MKRGGLPARRGLPLLPVLEGKAGQQPQGLTPMARNQPKRWVYSPPKPPKPAVPETLKAEVEAKAKDLIETVLKPKSVKQPPRDKRWNYIIDVGGRWFRSYFYFFSTYASPGPNA